MEAILLLVLAALNALRDIVLPVVAYLLHVAFVVQALLQEKVLLVAFHVFLAHGLHPMELHHVKIVQQVITILIMEAHLPLLAQLVLLDITLLKEHHPVSNVWLELIHSKGPHHA